MTLLTGEPAVVPAAPRAAVDGVTPRVVASIIAIVVGGAAFVLGPILDNRIPTVFRHIDWVSYS